MAAFRFSFLTVLLLGLLAFSAVQFVLPISSAIAGGSSPEPTPTPTPTPPVTPTPVPTIQWDPIGKACLPTPGRMQPIMDWRTGKAIKTAPCHCPPTSYCPETIDEWNNETKLPMIIQQTCCKRPYECTIDVVMNSGTACPNSYETGPEKVSFCSNYTARPTTDPALLKKRETAAKKLDSCMVQCKKHLTSAIAKLVPMKDSNHTEYLQFVSCERTCRTNAATELGLPQPDKVANFDMHSAPRLSWETSHVLGKRMYDFSHAVFTQWRMSPPERRALVDRFLTNHPAHTNYLPIAAHGLDSHLECDKATDTYVCNYLLLNNDSCSSCLAPGTKVTLADGSTKAIELIERGTEVKSDKGTSVVEKLVKREWPTLVFYSINGGELRLTADHPIQTTKGWRAIDYNADLLASMDKYGLEDVPELKVGDILITEQGEVPVTSIEASETLVNQTTYNLRLVGGEGFYANGILVKDN